MSEPAKEEAFFNTPLHRKFARLQEFERLPDESTILDFRHHLDKYHVAVQILATVNALLSQRGLLLKAGTVVDVILIAAPTPTQNKDKSRDSKMHYSKKSNKWYVIEGHPTGWGMKAHICVDAQSGLACTVRCSMGRKTKLLATQVTRQLRSARMPSLRLTGT